MKLTIYTMAGNGLVNDQRESFHLASTAALISTNRQNVHLEEDLLMAWCTH